MSGIVVKEAGEDGGCDPTQLVKRGWRIHAAAAAKEPTCIKMQRQENKNDKEIWLLEKYTRKPIEPPTKEELDRITRIFSEGSKKLNPYETAVLVRFLPSAEFDAILKNTNGIKSKEPKASCVISTPFVYEDGGDIFHNCGICGKKGHPDVDCGYLRFVPPGINVGPAFVVKCRVCYRRVNQPVGVCQYCGSEGGFADKKLCIFCFKYGDHLPEECPTHHQQQKTPSEAEVQKQKTSTGNFDFA